MTRLKKVVGVSMARVRPVQIGNFIKIGGNILQSGQKKGKNNSRWNSKKGVIRRIVQSLPEKGVVQENFFVIFRSDNFHGAHGRMKIPSGKTEIQSKHHRAER